MFSASRKSPLPLEACGASSGAGEITATETLVLGLAVELKELAALAELVVGYEAGKMGIVVATEVLELPGVLAE